MLVCNSRVGIFTSHMVQAAVLRHSLKAEKVCCLYCNIEQHRCECTHITDHHARQFRAISRLHRFKVLAVAFPSNHVPGSYSFDEQVICHILSSQISADQQLFGSRKFIRLPKQHFRQGAVQDCTHMTLGEDSFLMN